MNGKDVYGSFSRKELGFLGERIAGEYLQEKEGYKIMARNYRCRLGEIDMVALDGNTVAFVEIRSSRARGVDLAGQSINNRKQTKLRQLASFYLKEQKITETPCRFDVVLVFLEKEGSLREIRVLKNAF